MRVASSAVFILLVGVWAGLMTGCGTNPSRDEARTSICELVSRGAAADGEDVRLTAILSTDGIESSNLTDPKCPGVSIAPYFADRKNLDSTSMNRLKDELWGELGESRGRDC